MPFEGSHIQVTTSHSVPLNDAFDSVDEQIKHVEETWRRVFAGADNFHIKVEQVDVYSADFGSSKS